MSKGVNCHCPERAKPIKERAWLVVHRNCNYSAFNGYHRTPSNHSAITCKKCGAAWRTNANYVEDLADGDY